VWFSIADSKLELAATDGKRLMHYSTPVEGDATGSLIIPANVIKRIAKLEEAELSYNENMFLLVSGNTKVAGRMIEGRFPNVHKILEANDPCNARREMDRTLFIGALKRASLMTDKEQYGVSFCMSGRCLILRAQAASVGKAVVRFDCETEWGDANFEVILDVNMTREMMESLCSETIEMQTHGESGAVFFKSNGVTCVQMPMSR
jgi:DNA polymerase III sliding clamp (beta) subunit (PCNA family)